MSDWTGNWVADKMKGHTEVSDVGLLTARHVQLTRKKYSTIIVGTTAVDRFDASVLTSFLEGAPEVAFVVNVPKESYVTGSALRLSARHGIPIGGLGDLMRAVSLPDVSEYVSKEIAFIERGLTQHTRIESYERLDDRRYLVKRRDLSDVHVVFLNEYELTADHVRTARSRYGAFTMLVITNPNGRSTSSAANAAEAIGCHIYKWGDFLGALNRR
jgi:hypothetical protein